MTATTEILLDIQQKIADLSVKTEARIGKIYVEITKIQDVGDKTLEQALKTNGRVNKLEEETVPCVENKIKILSDKTKLTQKFHEKPYKIVAAITVVILISKFIPDFTIQDLFDFIKGLKIII